MLPNPYMQNDYILLFKNRITPTHIQKNLMNGNKIFMKRLLYNANISFNASQSFFISSRK